MPPETRARKILVLGAAGFIGRELVAALASAGWEPVAAGRDPRRLPPGVEHRICDATSKADVQRAAKQTQGAVNAVGGRGSAMIAATANLCAAYAGCRSSRIVHLSSMSVYGDATGLVGEDAKRSATNSYGAAKITCENMVSDFVASGRDAVILRPGIVHGPGGAAWTWRIAALLRAHRIGDLGARGEGICNLITAADVARACVSCLAAAKVSGEAINLGSAEPPSWNAYFESLARATNVYSPSAIGGLRLALETRALAPPLQAARLLLGAFGKFAPPLPPPIPASLASLWRQPIRLDHRKADALLGFVRTPDAQGIEQAARWLRARRDRGAGLRRERPELAKLDPALPTT